MIDSPSSADSKLQSHDSQVRSIEIAPQWILIFSSIALLAASQFMRTDLPREQRTIPNLMIPLSLALFYLGLRTIESNRLPAWIEKPFLAAANWLKVTPAQVFSLIFALLFSIMTTIGAGFGAFMFSPLVGVLSWVVGILLVVYGGSAVLFRRQRIPRIAVIAGILLFSGAMLIRSINTTTIPEVLSGDEASSGLFAVGFLQGKTDNIFIGGWFSFPVLHNFLQSISILIFGQTTQALRLLAALAGALTVMLVFFVGRSMYGFTGGLMAGIFLAGMHFHNHFSRIGLNNIWDGFFITLTLGFLWIGWQQNKRAAYLIAGLGLGLSQYFYTTGRIIPVIILAWLITAGLSDRARLRRALPNLVIMLWIAFIVVLPLGWFYLKHPDEFMAPLNRVSIVGDWIKSNSTVTSRLPIVVFFDQIWQGFLGYFYLPLRAWYIPGVPVLRTLPGIAFLLGLVFMLVHPKDTRSQLIIFWLLAIAAAVGLSESTPAAQRYVAAAPAASLLIAFSLQSLGVLLSKLCPNRAKWVEAAIVIVALFLAADDARFYYGKFTQQIGFGGFDDHVAQTLALRLKNEPPGLEVVFIGYPRMGYHSISSLPYLAPQIKFSDAIVPWGSAEDPKPVGKRVLFAFLPGHESDQAAVEAEYPGGSWSEHIADNGILLFRLYEVQNP